MKIVKINYVTCLSEVLIDNLAYEDAFRIARKLVMEANFKNEYQVSHTTGDDVRDKWYFEDYYGVLRFGIAIVEE